MTKAMSCALVALSITMFLAAGCDPRGGGDPRSAPGCTLAAYRCDGDVLQICELDPVARRTAWLDVQDCAEFGDQVGQRMACATSPADGHASCVDAIRDGGVRDSAVEAREDGSELADCTPDSWRCHDNTIQGCARHSETKETAWWNVRDCTEAGRKIGRPLECQYPDGGWPACEDVETDGGF